MKNFLNSNVLPGQKIPEHEHRKIFVILIVVVIIALFVLGYLWKSSKDSAVNIIPTNSVVKSDIDPVIQGLKNSIVELPQQEAIDITRSLSKSVKPVTGKQSADIISDLQKSIK